MNLSWRQIGRDLSPPFVAVLRPWFNPNELTAAGASMGILGAVALAAGSWPAAIVLCLGCAMCDWLDGELARATDQITPFGAVFDSVLDRLSDCAPLAGLIAFFAWQGQPVGASAAGSALMVSILIPYAKARIEAIGYSADIGVLSRAPRQALFLFGLVLGPTATVWALGLITVFGTITVIQRLRFAHTALET